MRSVKKGDWKLIKYDVMHGTVRETQLFNLRKNPDEFIAAHGKKEPGLTNLAADPAHEATRKEMEALLLAEMRRLDDPYRLWDQPDDGLEPPGQATPRERKGAGKTVPGRTGGNTKRKD